MTTKRPTFMEATTTWTVFKKHRIVHATIKFHVGDNSIDFINGDFAFILAWAKKELLKTYRKSNSMQIQKHRKMFQVVISYCERYFKTLKTK